MGKPTDYGRNLESTPRQAFQQAACQGIRRGEVMETPVGVFRVTCARSLASNSCWVGNNYCCTGASERSPSGPARSCGRLAMKQVQLRQFPRRTLCPL